MPRTVTQYDDDELGLKADWDKDIESPDLRRDVREGRIAKRELERERQARGAAEAELTMYRAGIPNDEKGQAFVKVYEGDRTDPQAIKEGYERLFGELPKGGAQQVEDPAAAARRVASAGNEGSGGTGGGTVDLADAIRGAKSAAEVLEVIRRAERENPEAHIRVAED